MKAKKWLIGLLSLACISASSFGVIGCGGSSGSQTVQGWGSIDDSFQSGDLNNPQFNDGQSGPEGHSHYYVETVTPPTCTQQGYSVYTCACGDTRMGNYVNKIDHVFDQNDFCSLCLSTEGVAYRLSIGGTSAAVGFYTGTATNVVIASTYQGVPVTSIGDMAFLESSSLTKVVIPDSVTSIGGMAFYNCSSLTSIEIPDGVMNIGDMAFYNCSSLTKIVIPDSVTSIGDSAFSGCSSLTSIEIPDGVMSIGNGMFSGCSSLTSIEIPDGVMSIGGYAFSGCSSLISIKIPDGITSIGNGMFSGCSGLTSIEIPDGVMSIGGYAFSGCSSLTSIEIPDGVTSISNGMFSGCSSLTSIEIPDSVTSIGEDAFLGCDNLQWNIHDDGKYLGRGNNPYWALIDVETSYQSTTLTIHKDVELLAEDALCWVYIFTIINIEESNMIYTSIEGNLYTKDEKTLVRYAAGKTNTSFTVPDVVTSIEGYAFAYCMDLTNVKIPDSVTSIDVSAFYACRSLTSVVISDSVTSIGNGAFSRCSSLTSIEFKGTIAQWNAIEKGQGWHDGVPATEVVCSDGKAEL